MVEGTIYAIAKLLLVVGGLVAIIYVIETIWEKEAKNNGRKT